MVAIIHVECEAIVKVGNQLPSPLGKFSGVGTRHAACTLGDGGKPHPRPLPFGKGEGRLAVTNR